MRLLGVTVPATPDSAREPWPGPPPLAAAGTVSRGGPGLGILKLSCRGAAL